MHPKKDPPAHLIKKIKGICKLALVIIIIPCNLFLYICIVNIIIESPAKNNR